MMILYYTDGFDRNQMSSHGLLRLAVEQYLLRGNGAAGDPEQAAEISARAEELVRSIVRGPNGKPSISGFPAFSISHSGRWWAVLIGAEDPVGLDLQVPKALGTDRIRLAERFFDPADAEAVRSEADRSGEETVFWRIWVRREALIKALGSTVISPVPAVSGTQPVTCGGADWFCGDLALAPGLYGACCAGRSGEEILLFPLDPNRRNDDRRADRRSGDDREQAERAGGGGEVPHGPGADDV